MTPPVFKIVQSIGRMLAIERRVLFFFQCATLYFFGIFFIDILYLFATDKACYHFTVPLFFGVGCLEIWECRRSSRRIKVLNQLRRDILLFDAATAENVATFYADQVNASFLRLLNF